MILNQNKALSNALGLMSAWKIIQKLQKKQYNTEYLDNNVELVMELQIYNIIAHLGNLEFACSKLRYYRRDLNKIQGVPHQYGLHQYEFHQYGFQGYMYKISTSGISRIGYVVKFVLVEIVYVVPTSTNSTSTISSRSQKLY